MNIKDSDNKLISNLYNRVLSKQDIHTVNELSEDLKVPYSEINRYVSSPSEIPVSMMMLIMRHYHVSKKDQRSIYHDYIDEVFGEGE